MMPPKKHLRKILLIRFSSIGDIVLTTPVVRCLKMQLGVEIHYLTKEGFAPILEANPYIDKLISIQKKVSEVLPVLHREGYDCIVDLHKNLRSFQVKLGLFPTKSYTFDKINFEKWLLVNFKIDRLPNLHIVDRYMKAIEPFGIANDGEGLDYFLGDVSNPPFLNSFFHATEHLSQNEAKDGWEFIAFAIGAAHRTKRLPVEKVVAICQKIELPIVLLGGKGEAAEGDEIAQKAGNHVFNACGKWSINESATVIRQATKVITHDTGMMHIAAAFQKEIISIWGNTIPEFGMNPYFINGVKKNTTVEVKALACRPCSKIGYQNCPKGHFKCMMDIPEEIIVEKVNKS